MCCGCVLYCFCFEFAVILEGLGVITYFWCVLKLCLLAGFGGVAC